MVVDKIYSTMRIVNQLRTHIIIFPFLRNIVFPFITRYTITIAIVEKDLYFQYILISMISFFLYIQSGNVVSD